MWKMTLEIRPFRGTFFNLDKVGRIEEVIAPPYDVVDERQKRQLLLRSPYNVVRLILPVDSEEEFWNDSARLFSRWKEEGVFRTDHEVAVYLYRQAFTLPGDETLERTGVITLLRCVDFSQGCVLPHEMTFPKTRSQQLNLLRACQANFSQIFTLVSDEGGDLLSHLTRGLAGSVPILDFRDDQGVRHRLFRVAEGSWTSRLTELIRGRRAVIADGHHRYETAVQYAAENAARGEDHPSQYVSVCLYSSADPGLVSLPVHRVIKGVGITWEKALRDLEEYFDLERVESSRLRQALKLQKRLAFGLYLRGFGVLLSPKDRVNLEELVEANRSPEWKLLDVTVLHQVVISRILGQDPVFLVEAGKLSFTPWADEAMAEVDSGEAEALFLLRPTSLSTMWALAEKGERMPHKSTYFHPKLPSGLVMYDHASGLALA